MFLIVYIQRKRQNRPAPLRKLEIHEHVHVSSPANLIIDLCSLQEMSSSG